MLGEMLGEERGKITGMRVIPSEAQGPKVEVSFSGSGKILGIDVNEMATYLSTMRPGGSLYGEGQGVVMSKEGDSMSWEGGGVGKFNTKGGISWRGAIYYQTQSQKWSRLNGAAVLFEFEVDENNNTHSKTWEWK